MDAAIADLKSQKKPNYRATARKYNLSHSTLMRRFKGQTVPNCKATSTHRKKLSTAQEQTLVGHINKLSNRGLLPTLQIIKNIAEELLKQIVGRNWVHHFVTRYKNQLVCKYLRAIDTTHIIADNSVLFQDYYS